MKRTLLLTFCLILMGGISIAGTVTAPANIPNYYSSVNGASGKMLFDQVHTIANVGFSSLSYKELWTAYATTDLKANGKIWDMYGDCEFTYDSDQCGTYNVECDCYNREHSIPKSWFGGKESSPGSDIFHIVPTDGKVNGMRSNYAFGEVSSATYSYNGSKLGTGSTISVSGKTIAGNNLSVSYTSTVFEPVDEYKGDFARGYFGTMIKWAGDYQAFTTGDGAKIFSGTYTAAGYFGLTKYGVALLLKWHRQDPVSQKEIDRNNGIQKTQGNRNPFIDYPYLVEYIWGSHAGETVNLNDLLNSSDSRFVPGTSDGYLGDAATPTLTISTSQIAFGGVAAGETTQRAFTVKGNLLTSAISLTVTGTNANLFTVSPTTISAANANATNTITITYKPTTQGEFSATLHISSGTLSQDIALSGSSAEVCTISWLVNGQEYTTGNPTTSVAVNARITTLPTAPTSSCNNRSEQFVGWSESTISTTQDEMPDDLFSSEEDAPIVTHSTNYHAVFAHLEGTGAAPQTTTWTPDDNNDWTMSGMLSHSDYMVLVSDAYLESPEINLAGLDSIHVIMRTYGGKNYKTLTIAVNDKQIGYINAQDNSMDTYQWTNTTTLTGKGVVRFYSTTTTSDGGPGIKNITIYISGSAYTYSRYTTACDSSTTETVKGNDKPTAAEKILHNGQLLIRYNGVLYNTFGQIVSYE